MVCRRIGRENDLIKRAFKQQKHVGKCKINHTGSSAAMETEGVMRIFRRSENERNLQYTEYFGDGDSKAYAEVENVYDGIHVEKRVCWTRSETGWYGIAQAEKRK